MWKSFVGGDVENFSQHTHVLVLINRLLLPHLEPLSLLGEQVLFTMRCHLALFKCYSLSAG